MRAYLITAVLFAAACSASSAQTRVLSAAGAALEAICEDQAVPDLCDQALATLQSGDLAAAIAYLKADLVNNGHNREVAALLGLLESQLEKGLPFRTLPETDK